MPFDVQLRVQKHPGFQFTPHTFLLFAELFIRCWINRRGFERCCYACRRWTPSQRYRFETSFVTDRGDILGRAHALTEWESQRTWFKDAAAFLGYRKGKIVCRYVFLSVLRSLQPPVEKVKIILECDVYKTESLSI